MSIAGKLAFVTGAGSGIGRATCQVLAREGAIIIAADKNIKGANETKEIVSQQYAANHISLEISVDESDSVKKALKHVQDTYKTVPSIIVNSAGITRDNFLLKMSEQDFDDVINVNLKGTFMVMQQFANAMVSAQITGGSIINISSIVGKYGNIGQANYSASKGAVSLLTKTACKEFGGFGIRCNAVLPGFIESPMTAAVPDKVVQKIVPMIPLKRFGKPEEIGEVIAFLASDKSRYVNGALIEVTGGF